MQKEDPLARNAQVLICDLGERLTIFRDPAVNPSAHDRLMEMLTQVGIVPEVSCSATTPSDIQWMVRAGNGVALMDSGHPSTQLSRPSQSPVFTGLQTLPSFTTTMRTILPYRL